MVTILKRSEENLGRGKVDSKRHTRKLSARVCKSPFEMRDGADHRIELKRDQERNLKQLENG